MVDCGEWIKFEETAKNTGMEGTTRFTNLSTHGRKESKSKSGWNCSWSTWHEESNDRGSLIYESVTQSTSGESGRTTLCPFVLTVCAHLLNLPKLYSHAHPPKSLQIISKWSHPTTISYYNHCNLQKRIQSYFPFILFNSTCNIHISDLYQPWTIQWIQIPIIARIYIFRPWSYSIAYNDLRRKASLQPLSKIKGSQRGWQSGRSSVFRERNFWKTSQQAKLNELQLPDRLHNTRRPGNSSHGAATVRGRVSTSSPRAVRLLLLSCARETHSVWPILPRIGTSRALG